MQECDPESVTANPGRSIDELNSRLRKDGKRRNQILDLIGDMVKSLATLGHESPYRSVRVGRLDQLNGARCQREKRCPDTLLGNVEAVCLAESQRFV